MKNMFTIVGCCLLSAAAFASTNLPGKSALAGRQQSSVAVAASANVSHDAVLICHKGREITVDAHAVPAHLAHGDKLGSCTSTPPGDIDPK
ncbi:hypothetical protein MON38_17035 [Hymenobacter sp. DH14]|uniref:Uncharacterized protein n=1 Tax=Hymenobacter cyanobacteriorum TaxID=2926463 RepID=A0A9X1VN26_9BACT|nr:hypothetical protein [Hymenobacter cyanobacteriorum]MCI1189131.1 hypothetical protein [Hymenobacter cyanobacteriorum]